MWFKEARARGVMTTSPSVSVLLSWQARRRGGLRLRRQGFVLIWEDRRGWGGRAVCRRLQKVRVGVMNELRCCFNVQIYI